MLPSINELKMLYIPCVSVSTITLILGIFNNSISCLLLCAHGDVHNQSTSMHRNAIVTFNEDPTMTESVLIFTGEDPTATYVSDNT